MKEFGRRGEKPAATVREEFKLHYLDADGESAEFVGVLAPRLSGTDLRVISAISGGGAVLSAEKRNQREMGALTTIMSMLRRMMANDDGMVKANWEPVELPTPTDLDDDEAAAYKPCYRGPDGQIYEFDDDAAADKFANPSNWTTRRRWQALMNDDNDAEVEIDDLTKLFEWGVGLASDRPTE